MNSSPISKLVARRICTCQSTRYVKPINRLLSTTAQNRAQAAPRISPYGSAELLRRRNRPIPESVQDEKGEKARIMRRMRYSGYGVVLCALALFGTVYLYPDPRKNTASVESTNKKNGLSFDAPPSIPGIGSTSEADAVEQVETGTSTIPTFPKTIHISGPAPSVSPAAANETFENVEYQLVGLGIRTVSFLSIQVYVVGYYVAVPDIAALQERLIRTVDPVATTLVPGEKGKLEQMLLDPDRGEEIWNDILKEGGIRTAFRIVPTRNTDIMHMRDGFVRGITARSSHFTSEKKDPSFSDESFGQGMNDFKTVFGGGSTKKIPKGETLLLNRDAQGRLSAWLEDRRDGNRLKIGDLADERVSRLLWLNYLAGKNVSSEPARQNVVKGCLEFVERPVGTVATQVV